MRSQAGPPSGGLFLLFPEITKSLDQVAQRVAEGADCGRDDGELGDPEGNVQGDGGLRALEAPGDHLVAPVDEEGCDDGGDEGDDDAVDDPGALAGEPCFK